MGTKHPFHTLLRLMGFPGSNLLTAIRILTQADFGPIQQSPHATAPKQGVLKEISASFTKLQFLDLSSEVED